MCVFFFYLVCLLPHLKHELCKGYDFVCLTSALHGLLFYSQMVGILFTSFTAFYKFFLC